MAARSRGTLPSLSGLRATDAGKVEFRGTQTSIFCAILISHENRRVGGVNGRNAMLEEFKKFAMRGNVVDLAVGIIIGVAFGAIVASLVADIIMPIIGAITGGLDFSNYYLPLSSKVQMGLGYEDAKKLGAVLG